MIGTAFMIAEAKQQHDVFERMLTEAGDPFGLGGRVGRTSAGHDVPTPEHKSYATVLARRDGILHGYDHFSAADHEYAAQRHEAIAALADEHRSMFERMYGKRGERLQPAQRERFTQAMAGMVEMSAGGKRVALAHRKAAARR